jgi:hypothetical protein
MNWLSLSAPYTFANDTFGGVGVILYNGNIECMEQAETIAYYNQGGSLAGPTGSIGAWSVANIATVGFVAR